MGLSHIPKTSLNLIGEAEFFSPYLDFGDESWFPGDAVFDGSNIWVSLPERDKVIAIAN